MINFKQFITEATKEGDRVGIQHLYSQNKPELYSMSPENFKQFVSFLQQNKGQITPENSTVTEKVDGMALKVGNDEQGFFVRSSYSGKVYEPEGFASVIKYPPAREAFANSFDRIKHLVWSTFIVINIQAEEGVNVDTIRKKLIAINDKEVKFILPNVDLFHSVDLRSEVLKAQKAFSQITKQEQELEQVKEKIAAGGPGRNSLVSHRRTLVAQIQEKLLPIQKEIYTKIVNNLLKTEGLLGDIEGYVVKAGDLMFKVNSPHFMGAKFGAVEKEDDEELEGASGDNPEWYFDNDNMNYDNEKNGHSYINTVMGDQGGRHLDFNGM